MITAKFLSPLQTEDLGPDRFRFLAPLRYQSAVLKAIIVLPTGFVSDLDSLPRWIPLIYALLKGKARAPAGIHDFLYQTHIAKDQRQADAVIYEATGAAGPGIEPLAEWERLTIWSGVRVGGASAWESGPRRFQVLGNTLFK